MRYINILEYKGGIRQMVSVYLRDEVLFEVMEIAREKNEDLKRQGKEGFVTTGKVIAEIVEAWYQKRMC